MTCTSSSGESTLRPAVLKRGSTSRTAPLLYGLRLPTFWLSPMHHLVPDKPGAPFSGLSGFAFRERKGNTPAGGIACLHEAGRNKRNASGRIRNLFAHQKRG